MVDKIWLFINICMCEAKGVHTHGCTYACAKIMSELASFFSPFHLSTLDLCRWWRWWRWLYWEDNLCLWIWDAHSRMPCRICHPNSPSKLWSILPETVQSARPHWKHGCHMPERQNHRHCVLRVSSLSAQQLTTNCKIVIFLYILCLQLLFVARELKSL